MSASGQASSIHSFLRAKTRKQADDSERQVKEATRELARQLLVLDEPARSRGTHGLLCTAQPVVIHKLTEHLSTLIGRGHSSQKAAIETLVQIGSRSVPHLTDRLLRSKSARVQLELLAVLTRLTSTLSQDQAIKLMFELEMAYGVTGDQDVRSAIRALQQTVRGKP